MLNKYLDVKPEVAEALSAGKPGEPLGAFVAAVAAVEIGRLVSGVHWATDIIGSVLLSSGLFLLYRAPVSFTDQKQTADHM